MDIERLLLLSRPPRQGLDRQKRQGAVTEAGAVRSRHCCGAIARACRCRQDTEAV